MRRFWKVLRWFAWGLLVIRAMRDLITIPEDWESVSKLATILDPYFTSENLIWGAIIVLLISFLAVDIGPIVVERWKRWRGEDLDFICNDGFPCGEMHVSEDEERNLTIHQIRRVGIINNTRNTIRGVRVRLEAMYDPKDLTISLNPQLPQNLRVRDRKSEAINLAPGETEYWDVIKFWEEETKGKLSDIFICYFDKKPHPHCRRDLFKAIVTIYADDREKIEKEFALGVEEQNLSVFMPWDKWLNKNVKKETK